MIFILEAFFSGCISKVINDSKDYSWVKIKSVINDRHDQNISTRICRVIEKSLNMVTGNTYKNSDDLYIAIEEIFNEFKNHGDTLEPVKCGLKMLGADASDQRCENFLEKFYEGIRRDDDLYKAVMMDLEQRDIKINQEGFQRINEKLDRNHREIVEKLDSINDNLNRSSLINEENTNYKDLVFENNKKQDYIKIWNSRLFLHLDNDERPITLADAFIIPNYKKYHFLIGFFDEDTLDEDVSDENALDEVIEKFVNYEKTSTMLITGVPGMGKTSIVSWLAHKYETDDNLIILRFRDWDSEELYSGLLKAICNTLKCKRKDLNERFLVLDGFDEMKSLDRREDILSDFLNSIKDLEKSKIIITSRPTYITTFNFDNNIELLPFSAKKIQRFYKKITGIVLNTNEIDKSDLDVIGIPVILYMAIMSNIDITESSTKPELYNRIFAKRGGIFDRFSEYDSGSQLLRNADNIEKYLEFLQKIAFKMFEKDNLLLSTNKCVIPKLKFEGKSVSILEFPIKHLFENIEANIEFIHKSVYEYFVSDYIFVSIFEMKDMSTKKLAGIFGYLLKSNVLSNEILEFLEYKIRNEANHEFNIVNETFQLMLRGGMTYYIEKGKKNILCCEMRIFANMLEFLHLWKDNCIKFNKSILNYLNCNIGFKLNLKKADLRGINLNNMDLRGVNLEYAYLMNLDMRKICLENADLENAKLDKSNLCYSNLKEINLINASIIWADLSASDIRLAKISNAKMKNINFTGSDLRGSDLSKSNLEGACLNATQLGGGDLRGAILRNAELRGADLDGTNLEEADLEGVDFTFANLEGANLKGTNLVNAKLIGAVIQGSIWLEGSFSNISSQLRQADFSFILVENESERRKIYRYELLL